MAQSMQFHQLQYDQTPIATIDENYLGFTFDTSRLVGIGWWDQREPIDLNHETLSKRLDQLNPKLIRIGGTGSDYTFYSVVPTVLDPHFQINLTKKHLEEITELFAKRDIELLYNLNGSKFFYHDKIFQTNQVELIFDFFKNSKLKDKVHFEFGNEVNAFWMIHGIREYVSPGTYAKAYDKVQAIKNQYNPNWKILGPSHALWPKLGHPFGFIGGTLEDFIKKTANPEVASWHYYPAQSDRCPVKLTKASVENQVKPKRLDEIEKNLRRIKKWRDKYSPKTELWMSETGSAQCGGEKDVSDTFASTIWWFDQLALTAKYDHKRVYRQTILGGDYGLLEEESLEPRIDFWSSILWNRLMGQKVFKVKSVKKDKLLRTYLHSAKDHSGHTLLVINLDPNNSKRVDLPVELGKKVRVFKLSGETLEAKQMRLNDEIIENENFETLFQQVKYQERSGINLESFEIAIIDIKK